MPKAAKEDEDFRKEEAVLFARLSSPPVLLNDVSELMDRQEEIAENNNGDESRQESKRSRKV